MVNRLARSWCLLLPLLVAASASGVPVSAGAPPAQRSRGGVASDWPRWRGARFDGTATTEASALTRPFTLRVRWKRTLGAGYSGVVVADGHAVTMFSDGRQDYLAALSSDDGREQWRVALAAAFPGRDGSAGGPVSTPALDGGVAFALGPRGDLVAASLSTGKEIWRRQIVTEIGALEPHWGFTTSPLVAGDLVVVLTGGAPGHAVTAFNKRTGATVWSAGTDVESYQSPMLAAVAGQERLIVGGDQFLTALDPRDGREIWKYEHGGQGFYGKILNPVAVGADGLLLTNRADESVLLQATGTPAVAWKTRELKLNYATPVVHGGLIVGYSGAFLTCIDAATGALVWRSRPPGDGFPIVVDGHVVVLTKEGAISIAEADRSGYREKARLDVFSRLVWTPPSFADGRLYARDSYAEIAAVDVIPIARTTEAAPAPNPGLGTAPGSAFAKWVAEVERASDAAARVSQFLAAQPTFPIVEADRYAHIVYTGAETDIVLRADPLGTGRDLPLRRLGMTDMYYASLDLGTGARVAYQFVRNLGEVIADPRNPVKAASLSYAGPVSLLFMPGADRSPLSLIAPEAPVADAMRGRVTDLDFETAVVKAGHLAWGGKRKIHVYLPPGYDANPERRYPALYVLYGDEMLAGGHLDAILDREIAAGMSPMIAVFVQSTSGYEYARTFREAHGRMLSEELVPWMDGRFRTVPDAAQRGILGADEGAFGALDTALRYPRVFGRVAAQSVFALSKGENELLALIDGAPKTGQRFYVDWGRYDPRRQSDELDVPGVSKTLRDRLAARGFAVDGREWADGSATLFWTTRVVPALRAMFSR